MYASIRRYPQFVGSSEELRRRVEEGYVPIISRQPGFVAYYAVVTDDGVAASVTIFQDRPGAEESNRAAADIVRESLASLLPSPPETTAGELIIARTA
jgi:hypothetical protein